MENRGYHAEALTAHDLQRIASGKESVIELKTTKKPERLPKGTPSRGVETVELDDGKDPSWAHVDEVMDEVSAQDRLREYLTAKGGRPLDAEDLATGDRILDQVTAEIDKDKAKYKTKNKPTAPVDTQRMESNINPVVQLALEAERSYRARLAEYAPEIPRPPLRALLTRKGRQLWSDYRRAVAADKNTSH